MTSGRSWKAATTATPPATLTPSWAPPPGPAASCGLGGAWTSAARLLEEALSWVPRRSRDAAVILHELGTITQLRGDYDTVEQHYQESLAISEKIGNRAGVAASRPALGSLAFHRADYATAEKRHRAALAVAGETGHRAGIAYSYRQLGRIAEARGDYDTAEQHYLDSLAISEDIGNRAGGRHDAQPAWGLAHRARGGCHLSGNGPGDPRRTRLTSCRRRCAHAPPPAGRAWRSGVPASPACPRRQ
jgi:tetratricopeptide (TPR) repeat protein